MKKRLKTQVFLVELINTTDRADDEAKKVRALSKNAAKDIVSGKVSLRQWRIGDVVLARGNISKRDKETALHLRSICTGAL